jgi:hypothetical protein
MPLIIYFISSYTRIFTIHRSNHLWLQRCIFESDAKNAIVHLRKKLLSYLHRPVSNGLLVLRSPLTVSHIGRKSNSTAHCLAKLALSMPNQIWIEEFPSLIENIVVSKICLEHLNGWNAFFFVALSKTLFFYCRIRCISYLFSLM